MIRINAESALDLLGSRNWDAVAPIVNNRPGMSSLKSVVQSTQNLPGGWHDSYFHGNPSHRTCECGHWQPTLEKGESHLPSEA